MLVESRGYSKIMNEHTAIQEAASAGLKSRDDLLRAVLNENQHVDCRGITDSTVSKFRTVISMFNRTGHARFRGAPVKPDLTSPSQPMTLNLFSGSPADQQLMSAECKAAPGCFVKDSGEVMDKEWLGLSASMSTSGNSSSTFVSSITGDGSVSNGKGGSASKLLDSSTLAVCVGKPPVSGKRSREHNHSVKTSGSSLCHCKKKKSRVKKTVIVPAISSKIADIPADEFSWRKYGQKPIKGSPYPRGYYRCSTVRGCPAKKHVERANDDPTMLIVTYAGEHRHATQENTASAELTVFESAA